ncbi:FtsB family cell division protein [Lapidilactobacillus wuchangensis]|uniref:FtsB family cell division protein n=1 Tax=Lapidilactobacillus wuchangensis TaxID=2486001 RepID=UPI000F79D3CA|nr:septum formation initiator family protein [Lapidilactobacillus wuchangensis]
MQAPKQPKTKVTSLNNDFVIESQQQAVLAKQKRRIRLVHRRRILAILAIFVACVVFFGVQIMHAQSTNRQLQAQVAQQKKALQSVQSTKQNLKVQVDQLHDDDYLNKLIRYKYDYSKNGEIIFSLPENGGITKDANPKN